MNTCEHDSFVVTYNSRFLDNTCPVCKLERACDTLQEQVFSLEEQLKKAE